MSKILYYFARKPNVPNFLIECLFNSNILKTERFEQLKNRSLVNQMFNEFLDSYEDFRWANSYFGCSTNEELEVKIERRELHGFREEDIKLFAEFAEETAFLVNDDPDFFKKLTKTGGVITDVTRKLFQDELDLAVKKGLISSDLVASVRAQLVNAHIETNIYYTLTNEPKNSRVDGGFICPFCYEEEIVPFAGLPIDDPGANGKGWLMTFVVSHLNAHFSDYISEN